MNMKRKVIKQGHNTLTITLPSKWCLNNSVKPGDEIDIEDNNNVLHIATSISEKKISQAYIDLSGMDKTLIRWSIPALEKYGFDEIHVKFDEDVSLDLIDNVIKEQFIGYIIVNQTINSCVIKNLTKNLENEFDKTLNRAFMVAVSMAKSCYDYISQGKYDHLMNLIPLEKTNNQLTNYCQRAINIGLIDNPKDSTFLYVIVWNLEKVCDNYKYICQELSGLSSSKKISPEAMKLLKKTNDIFEDYYKIFSNFNVEKLNKLVKDKKKALRESYEILGKKNKEETILISIIGAILTQISDFTASTFAIKYDPNIKIKF